MNTTNYVDGIQTALSQGFDNKDQPPSVDRRTDENVNAV